VVNGGFETGALSPWSCTGGLGSVVGTPVHTGTKALKAAASNSDNATCSQNLTLAANHTYTLTAWVQGSYAFVGTSNAATNNSTWTSSSSYTKLSVQFTTGASGAVQVWVHGWYGQGAIYVDDVAVA
jgi:chitinase